MLSDYTKLLLSIFCLNTVHKLFEFWYCNLWVKMFTFAKFECLWVDGLYRRYNLSGNW